MHESKSHVNTELPAYGESSNEAEPSVAIHHRARGRKVQLKEYVPLLIKFAPLVIAGLILAFILCAAGIVAGGRALVKIIQRPRTPSHRPASCCEAPCC